MQDIELHATDLFSGILKFCLTMILEAFWSISESQLPFVDAKGGTLALQTGVAQTLLN